MQSNKIPFYFQLWEMSSLGDENLFEGAWIKDEYSIGRVGHNDMLFPFIDGATIQCQVVTIGIERVNTIAIFDPNGTVYNGHYQEQERMNLIQLYVTEDGHYPGTKSFENESVGSISSEWNDSEEWLDTSDLGYNPTIIEELYGHHDVLQFIDDSTTRKGSLTHQWENSYQNGQLELWMRISSTACRAYFS
ncbi:MAG: hypothetical protein ACW98F_19155, partial [Candidatus Hodarchaeales archaeon]